MSESRTLKSLKNAKIALLFYFLNLILNFFSRKVFIDYLGTEVLGLNTTATNLLGFLNLAELGIGTAISYTLYKPLYEGDKKAINEIVSVQGWLYRRIAYIVIVLSFILMSCFPLIFQKTQLPLWYAYGSFGALLISSLLGYFVNYKQIVLTADQKEYKTTISIQSVKILKVILQIIAVVYSANGYLYWLVLEVVMAVFISAILSKVLKTEYPWLKATASLGQKCKEKYPLIIRKTKQLFFHKIGFFVLSQTAPLIIYAYTSLTIVAIYGNYMLVITGVTMLMTSMLNSLGGGVGHLVAEGNKTRIKSVFWELISFRIWVASIICYCTYKLTTPFMILWIGEKYLLDNFSFFILVVSTFLVLTRTYDIFLSAYGLFGDIWSPIVEAVLNIGLSVLLGYWYGIAGVLLGSVISLFAITFFWKPYFLFKKGFKDSVWEYFLKQAGYIVMIVFYTSIFTQFLKLINFSDEIMSFYEFGKYAILIFVCYSVFSFLFFVVFDSAMRRFVVRVKTTFLH